VTGTIDNPVSYIYFNGVDFQHSSFRRPSEAGHVPLQAGMYLLDAYKLAIPGTPDKKVSKPGLDRAPARRRRNSVCASYRFYQLPFHHLASTGLDYKRGTRDDEIKGCVFSDIGGTGIQVGVYSDEAFETHLPISLRRTRNMQQRAHRDNLVTNCTTKTGAA